MHQSSLIMAHVDVSDVSCFHCRFHFHLRTDSRNGAMPCVSIVLQPMRRVTGTGASLVSSTRDGDDDPGERTASTGEDKEDHES